MGHDHSRCDMKGPALCHDPFNQQPVGAFNVDADAVRAITVEQTFQLLIAGEILGNGRLLDNRASAIEKTEIVYVVGQSISR
jgi:hypothetical protein